MAMSFLSILLAGGLLAIPFLGVPFTAITEAALVSQMKWLGIGFEPSLPRHIILCVVFTYIQAPALVTLFASLAAISFVMNTIGEDRMTRAIELLFATPSKDHEIVNGVFLAGITYGMTIWTFSMVVFAFASSSLLAYYVGSFPSPPQVYYIQLFILSPLLVALCCTLATALTLLAPRLLKGTTIAFGTTNPLATLSLAPLLIFIILLNIPGIEYGALIIHLIVACVAGLVALSLFSHKIISRRLFLLA